uniref:Voltage-gated purine nucleotide uniporter SLC17A9 n=1 Tax=Bos mutus grunniens TaxID=30521 RepID=A0A8B9Y5F2_BOSMU
MDRDTAVGHVPALLRPRQHACLRRLHEPGLRLEQERGRRCAQQLLLGLLPDSGGGRPPGGPVIPAPQARLGEGAPREGMWGLGDPRSELGWAGPALSCLGVLGSLGTPPAPQQDPLVWPILATWLRGSSWPPSCSPCRIGGEKVILLSASAWGFITVATPLLAHLGSAHLAFMTFSRILTGLLQGVYFPALTSLLSQKVRESERAFTYSTVGAGSQFGTLVTGAVGSLLLDWYGWPSVFYFSGGLTLLWVGYVYRCLLSERDLILALGILAQGLPVSRHTKVPWRQLFRKPSVWAAIISQLSAACSFFILLSWLPTFFKETFPSSKGWVFNVVPWLVAIPASLLSGLLSDHLINQGYRTITVRKFMQVMGLGLSSVFALCLGHTSSFCNSVVFASASIGLQTFNHSGISVNIQDLAPSCAGFLFGVVGVCLGGYLIETTGSWTSVFNLVAAISSLGLCTFLVFGKAQRVDLSPAHEDL